MDNSFNNWQTFKAVLTAHPQHTLQFQYAQDRYVDASYHITEIKQAPIISVDCGGKLNSWTEIIVQLWEPKISENRQAMKVSKALSIVSLVEKSLPLNPLGIVKIEFGNSSFDTRQMYPGAFNVEGENLVVNLMPDVTQCKAIGRGQSCGTDDNGEECCDSADSKEKPKKALKNLVATATCCTPESGCC